MKASKKKIRNWESKINHEMINKGVDKSQSRREKRETEIGKYKSSLERRFKQN
jgi:hypothetical protein